jgi:hypothetical protein
MQDLHGTMKDDLSALTTSGKATCTAFGMCHWRWQHGSEIGSTCSGGRRTRHIMSVWLLGAGSIVRHCLRWLRCVPMVAASQIPGVKSSTIENARGGSSRRCWKQRRPHRATPPPPRVEAKVGTVVVIGSIR